MLQKSAKKNKKGKGGIPNVDIPVSVGAGTDQHTVCTQKLKISNVKNSKLHMFLFVQISLSATSMIWYWPKSSDVLRLVKVKVTAVYC